MVDRLGRIISHEHQLAEWLKGNSLHNGQSKDDGECTPDFSCCHPKLLAPEEVRRAYLQADQKTRERFLSHFLAAFIDGKAIAAHIVTGRAPE